MNIWILALESVETRYTGQWYKNIPEQLYQLANDQGLVTRKTTLPLINENIDFDLNIITVDGRIDNNETTPGAFLNFASTNIWKSSQLEIIAEQFSNGTIQDGDQFLITDAWNPAILQLKYMIDLLGLTKCKIHAIWHAGQYDPHDFLGRCISDKRWAKHTEAGLFYAIDHNYFATEFHLELFVKNVLGEVHNFNDKIVVCGQPHEYLVEQLLEYTSYEKEELVIFPHRVAPEKQPEIFNDLARIMRGYNWVTCQERKLTKTQYHEMLGKSKIMFSASLQETLGIGAMEAILTNCIPLVPDRLSYSEMYLDFFKYPSEWTINYDAYKANSVNIQNLIRERMNNYNSNETKVMLEKQKQILLDQYLQSNKMYNMIISNLIKGTN